MSQPPSTPRAGPSTSGDKSNSSPLPIPPLIRSQSHHSTASKASKASKPISRTSSHNPPTNREVLQLLADAESAVRDLRADVSLLNSQLSFEQDRADNAELKAKEACIRFKDANDARIVSQSEIVRLTEELRLYKDALEQAQKEIFRAQGVMKDVEDRRRDAEESAAKSRTRLRKLMEEKMIEVAREEGRKQGLQEGLEMGKDVGYVHGRSKGYAQGRVTADRVLERYFSGQSDEESNSKRDSGDAQDTPRFRPEPISRASSSEQSRPRTPTRRRTQPQPQPQPQSQLQQRPPQTSSARSTMFSPAHALHDIPSDGWIPEADSSLIIRLPPPHEFQRPRRTPSPISSSPGTPLRSLPVPLQDPVLMVPEPRSPGMPLYTVPSSDSRPQRTVRRRASGTESVTSTRTSELELLSPPEHPRSSGLSVIPEVTSIREQSTPSSRSMRASVEDDVDESGFVHVSMPAPRTSRETIRLQKAPSVISIARSPAPESSRPTSTSSSGTVGITIQPPSRPASNMSQITTSGQLQYFLSPADADRPLPPPPSYSPSRAQATPAMVPLPATGSTMYTTLPAGQLPLGFVPAGPPTPRPYTPSSSLPAPPAAAQHGQHQYTAKHQNHQYTRPNQSQYAGNPIVIPCSPKSPNPNPRDDPNQPVVIPPPSQKFAPESDESSSDTSSDADVTRTPRRKYRAAGSAASLYTATGTGSGLGTGVTRYSAGVALSGSAGGGTPRVGLYGRSGSGGGGEGYASMSMGGGGGFGRMAYSSEQGSVRG
ncbi:hypothetical protein DEU56DRAFT_983062 [Suillus clintonianus]|uniref:uncharacterized protein n=1 Tax=Suillus clintonianus TaxID=1904413 RepID=UPI001B86522B|nr:uncharacterized protein DEU56DRAFT_983062 [Suillus clintonianus]KAG2125958.1 hypothetical protein DEU56DRAFT_983062 [Suillus clintonianus]